VRSPSNTVASECHPPGGSRSAKPSLGASVAPVPDGRRVPRGRAQEQGYPRKITGEAVLGYRARTLASKEDGVGAGGGGGWVGGGGGGRGLFFAFLLSSRISCPSWVNLRLLGSSRLYTTVTASPTHRELRSCRAATGKSYWKFPPDARLAGKTLPVGGGVYLRLFKLACYSRARQRVDTGPPSGRMSLSPLGFDPPAQSAVEGIGPLPNLRQGSAAAEAG